jgi:hypothetical protein
LELLLQPAARTPLQTAPTTETSQDLFMRTLWRATERCATLDAYYSFAAPRFTLPHGREIVVTLRRYVESIAAKLELVALFGDKKITLAIAQLRGLT